MTHYKTKKQIASFCLGLGADVYEDYPFDDNWMAMRHLDAGKTICFCYEYYIGEIWVNVKCDPDYREYWLQKYPGSVKPAYHQNKRHWLTIVLDGTVADEDIESMLKDSYILTKKRRR